MASERQKFGQPSPPSSPPSRESNQCIQNSVHTRGGGGGSNTDGQRPMPSVVDSSYVPQPQKLMPLQSPKQVPLSHHGFRHTQFDPPTTQPTHPLPPPPYGYLSPPPPLAPSLSKEIGYKKTRMKTNECERGVPQEREKGSPRKQNKPLVPQAPMKNTNEPSWRAEAGEKSLGKKKGSEKQRQEEKNRKQTKQPQMSPACGGNGSIMGSLLGESRGNAIVNRSKKPTTFMSKLKFRNQLPDPSAQPKLVIKERDPERFTRHRITSMEQTWKPPMLIPPDLGIPLDLIDMSVYNPPRDRYRAPLAPEDAALLSDDEVTTPVEKEGARKKESSPTEDVPSWLVRTEYISPTSTEKQAKESPELKEGHNIVENPINREELIKKTEESFEAVKEPPVHPYNKDLYPVEVLPLFPNLEWSNCQLIRGQFDSDPIADSEIFGVLDPHTHDEYLSRAVLKSFKTKGSDPEKPEKFLACLVPSKGELIEDMHEKSKDFSYSWLGEYQWDVREDDENEPPTYLLTYGEKEAKYLRLPTRLCLKKGRTTDGESGAEVEPLHPPSKVTVSNRPVKKGGSKDYSQCEDAGQSSGAQDNDADQDDEAEDSNDG